MDEKQQQPHGPEAMEAEIVRLYVQLGMALCNVAERTGVSYPKVRSTLVKHGVQIRGRGSYALRGSDHPSSKLTDEDMVDLASELMAGQPHGDLARRYDLSRERVRQIAVRIGAPSGRQLQQLRRMEREKEKAAEKEKLRAIKREQRAAKYRLWREMWEEGLTVKEIAEALNQSPGAVSVRIVNLRKQHPDWFPLRRKPSET